MLDAVAGKDLDVPIIHPNRNTNDKGPLWELQTFPEIGVKVHDLRSLIKLGDCEAKGWGI